MAHVQSRAAGAPASATPTLAFTSNVGANSTLVVGISIGNSIILSGPTDTLGNTYTSVEFLDDSATSGERMQLWVAICPTGGANTVTLHLNNTPADGGWCIAEFSGRDTVTPIGGHTQAVQATPGTGANGVTCGPITAVTGDDIVLFLADSGAIRTNTFTAGTSYTERVEGGTGGADIDTAIHSRDNAPSGSQSATAMQANNERTLSIVVALVAAGGGTSVSGSESATLTETVAGSANGIQLGGIKESGILAESSLVVEAIIPYPTTEDVLRVEV